MTTSRKRSGQRQAGRARKPKPKPQPKPKPSPLAAERWAVVEKIVSEGRCRDCGRPRGVDGSARQCNACRLKHNARQRERYARMLAAYRSKSGS